MAPPSSWFSIIVELGPEALPRTVHSLTEVARATDRTYAAVKAALRGGRLTAVNDAPVVRRDRRARAYVAATPEQLLAWRRKPVEDVLRNRPDLPQEPGQWVRAPEAARRLGVATSTVYRRIRHGTVRRLAWDSATPFREEVRYWLPDIGAPRDEP